MSRPEKPPMTDEEYEIWRHMKAQGGRGSGFRAVAQAISRRRGATTFSRRRNVRKGVSEWWVRDQVKKRQREETRSARKPVAASESGSARGNPEGCDERWTERQTQGPGGKD